MERYDAANAAEGKLTPYKREGPIKIIKDTVKAKGITGLYSGCSALVVGNSLKAGVRFVSYDHFKQLLADPEVCQASSVAECYPHFHALQG